jgi:pimeloyl-ACP methyl ester carboxylesterase
VLASIVGVAGCSGTTDKAAAQPPQSQVQQLQVGGQGAVAVVPGQPPVGLVIYLHGVDDDASTIVGEDKRVAVVNQLVADGYVVAASDAYFNAWGNPSSQDAYVALAADLSQRYGTSRTFLLAESMGGAAGLQILANDRIPGVLGLAGISPLVDIDVAVDEGQEASLRKAYGGALPADTDNPAKLPTADFAGKHLRFYLAPKDEVVVSAKNADPLVERIGSVADVSVVNCQGGHVDDSCFQPDDLAGWFNHLAQAATQGR